MNIKTIDEGVHTLLKRGFDNPHHTTGDAVTMKKSKGGSHYLVWIADDSGEVTFKGMTFAEMMKDMGA